MRLGRALAGVVGATYVLLLVLGNTAAASCAEGGTLRAEIDAAETVFVGTVQSGELGNTMVIVDVEDVWKGDVPEGVQVQGGQSQPNVASSVDRDYEIGERYLFVLRGSELPLKDDSCTATQVFRRELELFDPHPDTDVAPGPALEPVSRPLPIVLLIGSLVVAVGAGVMLARGRPGGAG